LGGCKKKISDSAFLLLSKLLSFFNDKQVVLRGNGAIAEEELNVNVSQDICNGSGSVSLNLTPGWMPRANLDKNFTHNVTPADLASQASNVASDWEVSVSKDVTILDQAMKVVADLPLNKKAARVAVTTNVDKLGDVTLNLVQRGNTNHLRDKQAVNSNVCSVAFALPLKEVIDNDSISADVSYDILSNDAKVRAYYNNGDVNVKLQTVYNTKSNSANSMAVLTYTTDDIKASVSADPDMNGEIRVSKDRYSVRCPYNKSGVNTDDIQLRVDWSQDL